VRIYPIQVEPNTLVCDADPINTVFINHRGEVNPCVYLGLTVEEQVPRFYQGESHPFDTLSFGKVCDGLTKALDGAEREKYVSAFKRRNVGKSPLEMFTYLAGESDNDELSPPPTACQHCYKILGI